MAKQSSGSLMTFGIVNIFICLVAPCASCVGVSFYMNQPQPMLIQNQDVGPQFKQHLDRELPHAKAEAIGAIVANTLVSILLIIGSIGLFSASNWARWVTVFSALLLILCFCLHDVYQLAVFRPSVMNFLEQNMPPQMQGPEREGFKIGFSFSFFLWSCANPIFILYLGIMCLCVMLSSAFNQPEDDRPRRRGRDYDDDDEDD